MSLFDKKSCLAIGGGAFLLGYLGLGLFQCGILLIPGLAILAVIKDYSEKN